MIGTAAINRRTITQFLHIERKFRTMAFWQRYGLPTYCMRLPDQLKTERTHIGGIGTHMNCIWKQPTIIALKP